MEPDSHERLRELCRGITLRSLPADAITGLRSDRLGTPVRALIARDPDEFEELLPLAVSMRERLCPVCRTMTELCADALRASLELEFPKGLANLGRFVWVHTQCFAKCSETGQPRSFPW